MDYLYLLIATGLAYVIGSIPFAVLVGKNLYNIDVREHGSGNPGATNALRVIGPLGALIVFVADVLKGVTAIYISYLMQINLSPGFPFAAGLDTTLVYMVAAGLAVIIGHSFSAFLGFKGGKGIATAVGTIAVLFGFKVMFVLFLVWTSAMVVTRYVSVASLSAAYILPYLAFFMFPSRPELLFFSCTMFLIVAYTHRENVRRLLKGTELKATAKKPVSEPETFASIRNL